MGLNWTLSSKKGMMKLNYIVVYVWFEMFLKALLDFLLILF